MVWYSLSDNDLTCIAITWILSKKYLKVNVQFYLFFFKINKSFNNFVFNCIDYQKISWHDFMLCHCIFRNYFFFSVLILFSTLTSGLLSASFVLVTTPINNFFIILKGNPLNIFRPVFYAGVYFNNFCNKRYR